MNRTVLINRLKLAASLIGSSHSLSQRSGYSRIITIIDDLKQQQQVYDVEYYDYDPRKVLEDISKVILTMQVQNSSNDIYNDLTNFIKDLESCQNSSISIQKDSVK